MKFGLGMKIIPPPMECRVAEPGMLWSFVKRPSKNVNTERLVEQNSSMVIHLRLGNLMRQRPYPNPQTTAISGGQAII